MTKIGDFLAQKVIVLAPDAETKAAVEKRLEAANKPPYPNCRHPDKCRGYCPRDPSCAE